MPRAGGHSRLLGLSDGLGQASLGPLVGFVAVLFVLWPSVLSVAATRNLHADFYVATDGCDAWSGKFASPLPGGADGPFATLDGARTAVRDLRHRGAPRRPVIVCVRGGTYTLAGPLRFYPEDSGTLESPTIYAAYPGEHPVLSGGRPLEGWSIDGRGWWHVQLQPDPRAPHGPTSLYVNGQRRFRTRLPDHGSYQVSASTSSTSPDGRPNGFEFAASDIRGAWANLSDVEVLSVHLWNMSRMRVAHVDEAGGVVRFTGSTCSDGLFGQYSPGQPYWVENVKEALGQPGRWYLDRPSHELVYVPLPGEKPGTSEVILPQNDILVGLHGDWRQRRWVSHLVFRGLTFAHSDWSTPPEGHHFPQSDGVLVSAVVGDGMQFCRFVGCTFTHTGAYALQLGDGCTSNAVRDCVFTDLGAGGVKIGFWAPQDPPEARTSHNVVANCLIAHGGRIHPGGTGVLVGSSHHNRIEHNEISDLYYAGVSLGYTWDESVSAHHNVVRDNHIHDIGQGILSDMGAIYTLGVSPGTVIRHNLIHDVTSRLYGGWGIYLDARSSEIEITGNIVYRTDAGSLHLASGRDNRVENNIFAYGTEAQIVRSAGNPAQSFDLRRNIFCFTDSYLLAGNWTDGRFDMDENLYWDTGGMPVCFGGSSLAQWRTTGHDEHSVIADPLFVDTLSGDFRLHEESPARRLGFAPVDMAGFGRIGPSDPVPRPDMRAFPDLSRQEPLSQSFEDARAGGKPPSGTLIDGDGGCTVRVSAEDALSGTHSLKFTDDGAQRAAYLPVVSYAFRCQSGIVTARFAARIGQGACLRHEWRDVAEPDRPGPSVRIDSGGALTANGRFLCSVPVDTWLHIAVRCPIGRRAPGEYTLEVRAPGEEHARVFGGLKHDPGFHRLRAIYFMADGADPGTAYVDDVSISADESEKVGSMNHTLAGLSANWLEHSQDYRPSAFWFWNSDMGAEQMQKAVDAMARARIREVVLHPIQGLTVEYLSNEYFSRCRSALGMLSEHGIRVWIYDEFGWPSGNAGGLLLRDRPDLNGWYLQFVKGAGGRIRAAPTRYDRVLDNTVGAPWARSEAGYLDTLNAETVAEFIRLTHERYWTECGSFFGGTIRGFFTDEPVTMMDARSERWGIWGAIGLPWTPRFPALFRDRFGYDIEPLYAGLAGDGPSKPKKDYWDLVKELHTEAYHRQIARWCHEHGVLYTGHMGEDQALLQVRFGGSVFQSLSAMDIPGVDYLGHTGPPDDRWSDLALVPSVALHSGKSRVFCEAFGIAPLDVRLSTMLSTCQMLGFHGVNDIALMGFHQSLDGIRKQTYWPPLFVQSPWWPFYPAFRDAVARSVALVSRGKRKSRYALLYPQHELEQKDVLDFDMASVGHDNPGGRMIDILCRSIYDAGETFDFVFPEMLDEASVRNGRIIFPHATYDALLAPGDVRFFEEDIRHLRRLKDAGGVILRETIDAMADRIGSAQPSWSSHLAISGGRPAQLRVFRFEYPDGALFAIRNSGPESAPVHITSPLSLTRWDPDTGDLTACEGGLTETLRACETAFFTCTREPLRQAVPAKLRTEHIPSRWNVTTELPNTARLSNVQFRHPERGWLSAGDPTIFKKLQGRAVTGIPHDFAGLSRVEFRGEFDLRSLPDTLGIVYEGGHLESLQVNGRAVDLQMSSALPYWDESCRQIDILGLAAAGRNTVTGVLEFEPFETAIQNDVVYAFHPMPACDVFVTGRFVLSANVLSPPDPAPVALPVSFAEAGFGEYAGIVRMSCRVETGADAARIRGISVSPIAEDAVEVLLNGTSLGTRLKAPYDFPVGHLPSGSHTLEIRISGTTANLFANPSPWGMAGVAWLVSDRP